MFEQRDQIELRTARGEVRQRSRHDLDSVEFLRRRRAGGRRVDAEKARIAEILRAAASRPPIAQPTSRIRSARSGCTRR